MTHRELVKLVRAKLGDFGITPYQLYQTLSKKISKQTVYNFLEHGKVIKSDTLLILLDELDLSISGKVKKHHAKR